MNATNLVDAQGKCVNRTGMTTKKKKKLKSSIRVEKGLMYIKEIRRVESKGRTAVA